MASEKVMLLPCYRMVFPLGSYLGVVFVRNWGGVWFPSHLPLNGGHFDTDRILGPVQGKPVGNKPSLWLPAFGLSSRGLAIRRSVGQTVLKKMKSKLCDSQPWPVHAPKLQSASKLQGRIVLFPLSTWWTASVLMWAVSN